MENIKNRLGKIIEMADCEKPACKNCKSYKNGGCCFGCVNERLRMTTPNYCCDNFEGMYDFNENTLETLKDLLKEVKRIEEGVKNLELLINGKINENDFNEIVG